MNGTNDILLRKLKYNGRLKSEWQGDLLSSPNPDWFILFHHPQRHQKFADGQPTRADIYFFHFLSMVQPVAVLFSFGLNGRFQDVKLDAALPASQTGQIIKFVDLDLDLIIQPDLSYILRDEEIFQSNKKEMSYPPEVVAAARRGIELGKQLVTSHQFPFDEVASAFMSSHLSLD